MRKAIDFINRMKQPEAWNHPPTWTAAKVDRSSKKSKGYDYDKMEPDLGFIYFSDGSVAGVRPQSKQAWIPPAP